MDKEIKRAIKDSISVKQAILADEKLISTIGQIVSKITECYQNGGKVLLCGNGGSASDAQHIAAELSGRLYFERPSLAAEALHVNSSYVTAVANDYSYEEIYARYISGVAKKGDILIGISTSGNSENILRGIEVANQKGMTTVGFTGLTGGKMKLSCDLLLNIPDEDVPRIQEAHILCGHIICELIEKNLFG